jgi:hypothetical protein
MWKQVSMFTDTSAAALVIAQHRPALPGMTFAFGGVADLHELQILDSA